MACGFVSRQFKSSVSSEEAAAYALLTCEAPVGSYLVVEGGGRKWLAKVREVYLEDIYSVAKTPVLTPEQERAMPLRLGPAVAVLELVAECSGDVCGPPATPVPIHAEVRAPGPGEVGAMLSLPRQGVLLGDLALPAGQALEGEPVYLPLEALRHHLLVVGTTGSGKTVLVKEIALQLANAGQNVVALDAVGHFYHLAYNGVPVKVLLPVTRGLAKRGPRAIARRAASRALWGRRGKFKARVFRRGKALSRIELEIVEPGPARLEVYPWALKSPSVLPQLHRAMPILTQQARIFYRRVLQKAAEKAGSLSAEPLFQWLTSPSDDVQRGRPLVNYEKLGNDLGLHVSTMENIVRAILALVETELVDVETAGGAKVGEPDYGRVLSGYAVVDLSGLNTHQQRLVVYRVLDAVYRVARPTTAVLIDEAHLFFPQTRNEDEQAFIEAHLTRLTRLGRARGIGVVFATHMPDDLNDVVLQLANTKVVLRSDLKVLEKLGVPAGDRRFIAYAERGLAYFASFAYRYPLYVKVKKRAVHFG
ncbi:ATP-binding protein [Thermoproteus tenax]|uniref:HerA helicase n=1 Tax=Thermoproteus tenax (strain ATCC 35583 / DSM 2078 / JCM 9277 / NBRC 100435 / Kra 1) TaxID=768679 RepID=G4RK05_THETK|nr:ATP-binding protein [Thermoproteus tenax]CCC81900.1 HerA helicase [Thermoproteus tenax Kra 1]